MLPMQAVDFDLKPVAAVLVFAHQLAREFKPVFGLLDFIGQPADLRTGQGPITYTATDVPGLYRVQQIVQGGLILIAVAADQLLRRR